MHSRRFLPHLATSIIVFALISESGAQTSPAALPPATDFAKLADFGNGNGEYPNAPLVQGTDGNLYGATQLGPYPSNGFAFKMTPTGTFSTFDYSCTENSCTGSKAYAGLVLASDGNFYGTTYAGGDGAYRSYSYHSGTLFQLNTQSGLSTIYSFCSEVACDDGDYLSSPLIQGSDGNLYGVTSAGGVNNLGTVFTVTTDGTLTTLHSFASTEGNGPDGGLIQATDGNFYGTTSYGGSGANCTSGDCGTIFKITSEGTLTTLYNFCEQTNCADGYNPRGSLIQAADGDLYGITLYGGAHGLPDSTQYGTVFKITTAGVFTSLYSFCALTNCADGYYPAGILQATDGNFYGATYDGGASEYGVGTLFKLTTAGVLTTLHDFCPKGVDCADGSYPGALVQATDGNFYGVTGEGGHSGHGIAFRLSMGLNPFVETVTASGAPGSSVIILGTNLTGASSVTFNGTPTAFTLVSSTEITATVPTGATTGPIVVTTPKSTLKSNKSFQITP